MQINPPKPIFATDLRVPCGPSQPKALHEWETVGELEEDRRRPKKGRKTNATRGHLLAGLIWDQKDAIYHVVGFCWGNRKATRYKVDC